MKLTKTQKFIIVGVVTCLVVVSIILAVTVNGKKSRGVLDLAATAVTRTTVSPMVTITALVVCLAIAPVSNVTLCAPRVNVSRNAVTIGILELGEVKPIRCVSMI